MRSVDAVIVGAGFAGLGMAIRLRESGIDNFVILEKAERVGGTWRDNIYPGAACDIESHLYSFSFAQNPNWSSKFAPQAEILKYIEHCVERFDLNRNLRLKTGIVRAEFSRQTNRWRVETDNHEAFDARILISATGGLSTPSHPSIAGLENFAGKRFHSARWDANYSLRGKRVAVIGTGASAIQIVPEVAKEAKQLSVFQRTPGWILPKSDRPLTSLEHSIFAKLPFTQGLARAGQYTLHELVALGVVGNPKLLRVAEIFARDYLKKSISDPTLRAQLTPKYRIGCKRILLSNTYFEALSQKHVALISTAIDHVDAQSVVTADGVHHEIDSLILATGFQAADARLPYDVIAPHGAVLNDIWSKNVEAYLGTSVAGFPNFFLLIGPNTGLGHSSMIYMMESQMAYVLDALKVMHAKKIDAVEVRHDVQERYNAELQERMKKTAWATGGCKSWYMDSRGRNTTLWPGFTFEFRHRTRRFDVESYSTSTSA